MNNIKIKNINIGDNFPTAIIAEIGINHNGNVETAKKLIDIAVISGCQFVKFQKRTIDLVYSKEELEIPRESQFGTTNGDLKRGLEFSYSEYKEIDEHCKHKKIIWFASPWDKKSVDFLELFDVPCYKIPSALLTDNDLILHIKSKNKPILLSTGMSTSDQIDHAVNILGDNIILFHCTSTYPTESKELNLSLISKYKQKYNFPIGYSGHEKGIMPSTMAVLLGANIVERHITLDRTSPGTDHAASLEPEGLCRLCRDIKQIPEIVGDGNKIVYSSEIPIMNKLRK